MRVSLTCTLAFESNPYIPTTHLRFLLSSLLLPKWVTIYQMNLENQRPVLIPKEIRQILAVAQEL